MARLIDLSTLCIGERNPNAFNDPERAYGWNDLLKILKAAPTVDAVEVVRCKDCKWLEEATEEHEAFCNNIYGLIDYVCGDDFCSYGERKDSDGNG